MNARSASRSHFREGVRLGLAGAYDEAVVELELAVADDPSFVEAHVSLGVALHRLGLDDGALERYAAALALAPKHAEAHYYGGNIHHIRQQMPKAIAEYTVAIGLEPRLLVAHRKPPLKSRLTDYTEWPVAMYWIAKPARRILRYSQSLRKDPHKAGFYLHRGAAYYELWNYECAAGDFDAYLRLKPDDVQVVHYRGLAYEQIGRFDDAIADYSRAIELNPNFAGSYYINRGISYGKMGDYCRSLADLDEGVRLSPGNPDGYYNRGIARYQTGNVGGARADFLRALELNPNDRAAQRWLERIQGDPI